MQNYQDLLALTKNERETILKTETERGIAIVSERTVLQKHAAKILVAMTNAKEIGSGDLRKEAKRITGHDIRETFQGVYKLVTVFSAVVASTIPMTEEEYDKAESSKLEIIAPALADDADDDLKAKIPDLVEMVKAGKTAKEIREALGGEKKEPKAVREMRERAEKAEAESGETKEMLRSMFENGTVVPVGFLATDIGKADPLVNSKQFRARLKSDLETAINTGDETAVDAMKDYFATVFDLACRALGENSMEILAAMGSRTAKAAAGQVIETPALEAAAA